MLASLGVRLSVVCRSNFIVSVYQHGVAVTEESVVVVNGVPVGGANIVHAAEGGNQHQQRRLGQVEVGQQHVDDAELESGCDEDIGLAGIGRQFTAARPGAVAAPTASLHFDAAVLTELEARGVQRAAVGAATAPGRAANTVW